MKPQVELGCQRYLQLARFSTTWTCESLPAFENSIPTGERLNLMYGESALRVVRYILDLVGNRLEKHTFTDADEFADLIVRNRYDDADRLIETLTDNGGDGIDDTRTVYEYDGDRQVRSTTTELIAGPDGLKLDLAG